MVREARVLGGRKEGVEGGVGAARARGSRKLKREPKRTRATPGTQRTRREDTRGRVRGSLGEGSAEGEAGAEDVAEIMDDAAGDGDLFVFGHTGDGAVVEVPDLDGFAVDAWGIGGVPGEADVAVGFAIDEGFAVAGNFEFEGGREAGGVGRGQGKGRARVVRRIAVIGE
jgi:hypothetical protein